MKRGFKKKGLSPVVATAMLIALVVVLAAIIFLWARGFFAEKIEKFEAPIEKSCEDVRFDMDFIEPSVGFLGMEIENTGNIKIHNFDIKTFKDGNSEIETFPFSVNPGETSPSYELILEEGLEKVIVYPTLLGNVKGKQLNRPFTCLDYGKTKSF